MTLAVDDNLIRTHQFDVLCHSTILSSANPPFVYPPGRAGARKNNSGSGMRTTGSKVLMFAVWLVVWDRLPESRLTRRGMSPDAPGLNECAREAWQVRAFRGPLRPLGSRLRASLLKKPEASIINRHHKHRWNIVYHQPCLRCLRLLLFQTAILLATKESPHSKL